MKYIEVLVLGLDTEKNEIYAEQNVGSSSDKDSALTDSANNPIWITLVDEHSGSCEDGIRANHENWLEQVNKYRTDIDYADTRSITLAGSALYYLLNREAITFTHEDHIDEDEDFEDDATCACGAFMEECENCGCEFCPECDGYCDDCQDNEEEDELES